MKIKPCPFKACENGEPWVESIKAVHNHIEQKTLLWGAFVRCGCQAEGPYVSDDDKDVAKDLAIEAWNERRTNELPSI